MIILSFSLVFFHSECRFYYVCLFFHSLVIQLLLVLDIDSQTTFEDHLEEV